MIPKVCWDGHDLKSVGYTALSGPTDEPPPDVTIIHCVRDAIYELTIEHVMYDIVAKIVFLVDKTPQIVHLFKRVIQYKPAWPRRTMDPRTLLQPLGSVDQGKCPKQRGDEISPDGARSKNQHHDALMNRDHACSGLVGPFILVKDIKVHIIGHLIFKPGGHDLDLSHHKLYSRCGESQACVFAVIMEWLMMLVLGYVQ